MMYEEAKLARKMLDRMRTAERIREQINEDTERLRQAEIELEKLEQECISLGGHPIKHYIDKASEISKALMRGNNLVVL